MRRACWSASLLIVMFDEETLERARQAFYRVWRAHDLGGWDLDTTLGSPFLQESSSGRLVVSLKRRESERAAVTLDLAALMRQEGAVTEMGLEEEFEIALTEKGIMK